jgi:hypothetical protein
MPAWHAALADAGVRDGRAKLGCAINPQVIDASASATDPAGTGLRRPDRNDRRARCREMCEQCKDIDTKIEHYQRVADRITDQTRIGA